MIDAIENNLLRGVKLLNAISDDQYSNKSVPPYFSSIGCNIRHVLDAFRCVFEGIEKGEIDFSDRIRNTICEEKTAAGIAYFEKMIKKLRNVDTSTFSKIIKVTDNLGSGKITINYTLESALLYAHSHAIHHFATIGFVINQLEIELLDADFGYNATTPKIVANF